MRSAETMPPSPTSTHVAPTPTASIYQSSTSTSNYPPPLLNPSHASKLTKRKTPWRPYVVPFETIHRNKYSGLGTEADPYIVDWLPNDAEDPQGWGQVFKWWTIFITAMATMAVALSSSAYSGGIEYLEKDFGASQELLTGGISLFVVGFAFGPLLWAPLSELYGRRRIFIISYVFLTLWTAVSAGSQTVAQLLVFRFLSGFFGSSPLSNAGGTISDVLDANQRGLGMAFFAAAPFLGPSLGPITGGFLGEAAGWRWIEGYLAIFIGVLLLALFFFSAETYAPFLLRQRAANLSKATGKVYRFRADAKQAIKIGPLFRASLIRPWKFLIFEPIVIILTIYTAIIYGILYLNFSAYPIVFQVNRGWSTGIGGLAFLGVLVGTILAVVVTIVYVNPQYVKTAKKRGGRALPEDRLPPAIWGGVLIVIGLAGFAATDGPNVHWIAPIIFGIPFGLGMVNAFLSVLGYLIDSYTIYAASVLAANSVLRSLFGAAFPLFTTQMYEKLGIHWAAALPAFFALACIPFTVVFYKYGAQIRAKCKYAADAERQMAAIMAVRMAQAKQQQMDQEENLESNGQHQNLQAEGQREKVGGTTAGAAEGEGKVTSFPAEQMGGVGGTAEEFNKEKVNDDSLGLRLGRMNTKEAYGHKEWTEYAALADRDEVDLEDDERMRLDQLHGTFGGRLAKGQTQTQVQGEGQGVRNHEGEGVDVGLGKPIN